MGERSIVVGVWRVVDRGVRFRLNVDRDGRVIRQAIRVDHRIVKRVFANESDRRCVSERAIGFDVDAAALLGGNCDGGGSGAHGDRVNRRDDVAIRVAIVTKQFTGKRFVQCRLETIVASDWRSIIWIDGRIDDVDRQSVFFAVPVLVTDFQRDRVFADKIRWRRVGVRTVGFDDDGSALVGLKRGLPDNWVAISIADGQVVLFVRDIVGQDISTDGNVDRSVVDVVFDLRRCIKHAQVNRRRVRATVTIVDGVGDRFGTDKVVTWRVSKNAVGCDRQRAAAWCRGRQKQTATIECGDHQWCITVWINIVGERISADRRVQLRRCDVVIRVRIVV